MDSEFHLKIYLGEVETTMHDLLVVLTPDLHI